MTAPVLIVLLALALMFATGAAWGDELERVPPITSATAKKECGACHMAYQPQFLPADAWRRMFGELDRHFGTDASLAESMRQEILDYYIAHAGKARAGEAVTSRITETPQWIQAHRKVKAADWTKPEVKFKGSCLACHKRADDGVYEEG